MPEPLRVVRSELLLGTDAAARMAHAARLAQAWLDAAPDHRVVCVNMDRTAWPVAASPRQVTMEEPTELAHALGADSRPDTLIVVDCLTLWLTASMVRAMRPDASDAYMAEGRVPRAIPLADAVRACAGPLVLVADGAEVVEAAPVPPSRPAAPDARQLRQTLGSLQQQAAAACARVTLVTRDGVMTLKDAA